MTTTSNAETIDNLTSISSVLNGNEAPKLNIIHCKHVKLP